MSNLSVKLRSTTGGLAGHAAGPQRPRRIQARSASRFSRMVCMASDGGISKIHFKLSEEVPFKTYFKVCGNVEDLGAWDLDKAPAMEWSDGDVWTLDVSAPSGTELEYKLVKIPRREPITWEKGSNRKLKAEDGDLVVELPQFDSCPLEVVIEPRAAQDKPAQSELGSFATMPSRAVTVAAAYVSDVVMETPDHHGIATEVVECAGLLPTAIYTPSLQESNGTARESTEDSRNEDGLLDKLMFWRS